jgi:ribonuclease-3
LVNNERLEYLGDAVLGSVIAEHLFKKYPIQNEGFLTQMRSKIVNGEKLAALAEQIGLVPLIKTQAIGEHTLKHISGDAFEALIGAIYIDKGYERTKRFILKNILVKHIDLEILEKTENNYKSKLIEWGQKYKKNVCFYTDVEPYDPTRFISYVSIGDNLYGSGSGISKKEAEQMAANETLKELR